MQIKYNGFTLPKYCTPEQYKKITGYDYPDNGPVWSLDRNKEYILTLFGSVKNQVVAYASMFIIIPNFDGIPPMGVHIKVKQI